jgi:hypothetical protein
MLASDSHAVSGCSGTSDEAIQSGLRMTLFISFLWLAWSVLLFGIAWILISRQYQYKIVSSSSS